MKAAFDSTIRYLRGLRRPSRAENLRLLHARGETAASFKIRDASPLDIAALARLHVVTWSATHGSRRAPSYELRERQWRDAFNKVDRSSFCVLVDRPGGELVGFAQGTRYAHSDLPEFSGELRKIYVLTEYQRLGLGRRLVGHVARRFLAQGIDSMVLFGEARNPSCAVWEALGGKRLYGPRGEFNGGYGWLDLEHLAATCPGD